MTTSRPTSDGPTRQVRVQPPGKRFRFHLKELMRLYGLQRGEVLDTAELSRETGLSRPTIERLRTKTVSKVEATTVAALTGFFHISETDLYFIEDAPSDDDTGSGSSGSSDEGQTG